jgi:hypothetical protein
VLAIIVLVRTILSISIDVEIDGHWPWDSTRIQLMQRAPSRAATSSLDAMTEE